MPAEEFGIQAGNARFKLFELVSNVNGVYIIIPIPEMGLHISLHYPNQDYPTFGAHIKVTGLKKKYPLELDQNFFSEKRLLDLVESFSDIIESGYSTPLDDSEMLVFPESLLNGFTGTGRRNYFDITTLKPQNWKITQTRRLPELVSRESPTVVGASLSRQNTAIIYDRKEGAFQLSLDDLKQAFSFDLFGNSLQRSLSEAYEDINIRRPEVLTKWTPSKVIEECKRILIESGAKS